MALRLSPAAFRKGVDRRLLDVTGVQEYCGLNARQSVWDRVEAGTLPAPILVRYRSYALWDKDEIDAHQRTIPTRKEKVAT